MKEDTRTARIASAAVPRPPRQHGARSWQAAPGLFMERPWDQITLAEPWRERAGGGLQTLIRRVGTKDGLARAVNTW